MMIIFGVVALVSQAEWPKSYLTWFLITIVWSSVTLIAMILKVIAFRNDKITRVYPIFFVESVFCLLLDIIVFNVDF